MGKVGNASTPRAGKWPPVTFLRWWGFEVVNEVIKEVAVITMGQS